VSKRKFNAGHMDRYIRLETNTVQDDGQRSRVWTEVKTTKAAKQDIELKRNNEDVDERTVISKGRTEFTIRYDRELYPLTIKRIVEVRTAEIYDIEEVRDFGGREQFMKIICTRIQQR
jgi:hypothetical protein